MNKRTNALLLLLTVLGVVMPARAGGCGDSAVVAGFLGYGSGSREFTDFELKATFGPVLGCLQSWVEDGGEKDGVPVEEWAKAHEPPRLIYRAKAMELIDALVLLDASGVSKARLSPWILRSIDGWPGPVKWNAWKALADLGEPAAVPLLRQEARRATGMGRTVIWEQLAKLSPESAVSDLEALGRSQEDYRAIGFALLKVDSPAIVPALQRLIRLDPGKASRYASQVQQLQATQH